MRGSQHPPGFPLPGSCSVVRICLGPWTVFLDCGVTENTIVAEWKLSPGTSLGILYNVIYSLQPPSFTAGGKGSAKSTAGPEFGLRWEDSGDTGCPGFTRFANWRTTSS